MIEELEVAVIKWAEEKGILDKSTPKAQIGKTAEEFFELYEAVLLQDHDEIKDGIGDVTVTLIIQAYMQGLSLGQCLAHSYHIISQRTGEMVDGVYVKDE